MLKIGVFGANGKMGHLLCAQLKAMATKYQLTCAVVSDVRSCDISCVSWADVITDDIEMLENVDVVIDFSNPTASLNLLTFCRDRKIALVIGTTGFGTEAQSEIEEASKIIPLVFAPNMSLSVNVLYRLAEIVAVKLKDFEVEISEAHHRYKKDAPSGTALKLGEVIAAARGQVLAECATYIRHGSHLERKKTDIGFSVIRGGDIVGMHEAMFMADGEMLSVKSQISNRSSFINGALLAAKFIVTRPQGLYNMFDVLGI